MEILLVLIPLSIVLLAAAVGAFVWAVRDGQFEDLEAEAMRVLTDEAPPAEMPPPADPARR